MEKNDTERVETASMEIWRYNVLSIKQLYENKIIWEENNRQNLGNVKRNEIDIKKLLENPLLLYQTYTPTVVYKYKPKNGPPLLTSITFLGSFSNVAGTFIVLRSQIISIMEVLPR